MKLVDFDTIIFDLDDTIWSGSEPDLWAKKLIPPLYYDNKTIRVYDFIGKYLQLHSNLKNVLCYLQSHRKKIGYSTIGGWENVPYEWQPCAIVLKTFALESFFQHMRVVQYKTGNKTKDFIPSGKTLFIDDNEKHLIEVKAKFPEVITLNRGSFESWEKLL
jgi:predicted phosphatase